MEVLRIKDVVRPNGPISRSTLYEHARAGRITLRKIGGSTVVNAADWKRYMQGEPLIHKSARA